MGAQELLLVRHGESAANVAASAAELSGAEVIEAPLRDADVPLTQTGVEQAGSVGEWLRSLPDDSFPDAIWASPYRRAADTARIATESQRIDLAVHTDERLRDRELGILDTLTRVGIEARYPSEAARRRRLGKFYYRPPGGESWADVALRVRSAFSDLNSVEGASRVLIVSHDAVIALMRYVCEELSETEILQLARTEPIVNASISRLVRPTGHGSWTVDSYNSIVHLEQSGTRVTAHAGSSDVHPH